MADHSAESGSNTQSERQASSGESGDATNAGSSSGDPKPPTAARIRWRRRWRSRASTPIPAGATRSSMAATGSAPMKAAILRNDRADHPISTDGRKRHGHATD